MLDRYGSLSPLLIGVGIRQSLSRTAQVQATLPVEEPMMPAPETLSVPLDMQEALRGFTIVLDVRGRRRALLRLWIACHLAGLAAMILGGNVDLSCEHAT